ncbi:MAG: hypothetical protein K2H43_00795 [Clostridia bacterium]|nr:hypothetical protein [Clostridia bacterium]
MKKLLAVTFAAAVCAAAVFGGTGCGAKDPASPDGEEAKKYTVYSPDGAPALSLAYGISKAGENTKYEFEYRVIASATVQAQVTGEKPAADFCVLPVNLASKLLGSGETYRMLGTVTNGNLYFLTTGDHPVITAENAASALVGKTVGCVQLTNVPGLTLRAALADLGVAYQVIENLDAAKSEDKVNLLQMGTDAANVSPAFGCDYYLCPEPAFTAKINGTAGGANPFKLAGDLQEIYGGENGYPQAVLVAKKSVIETDEDAVELLVSYFEGSAEYLASAEPSAVAALIGGKLTAGLTPSFNDKNLTAEVISRCSVRYTPAKDCKTTVNAFLAKLKAIGADFVSDVTDAFYYGA